MAEIIDGKALAKKIRAELKLEVDELKKKDKGLCCNITKEKSRDKERIREREKDTTLSSIFFIGEDFVEIMF